MRGAPIGARTFRFLATQSGPGLVACGAVHLQFQFGLESAHGFFSRGPEAAIHLESVFAEIPIEHALQVFDPPIGVLIAQAQRWLARTGRRDEILFLFRLWPRPGPWPISAGSARKSKDNGHILVAFANFADGFETCGLRVCFTLRCILLAFGIVPFNSPDCG